MPLDTRPACYLYAEKLLLVELYLGTKVCATTCKHIRALLSGLDIRPDFMLCFSCLPWLLRFVFTHVNIKELHTNYHYYMAIQVC